MRAAAGIFIFACLIVSLTGCASSGNYDTLNNRVNILTTEVARIDSQLSETASIVKAQQVQGRAPAPRREQPAERPVVRPLGEDTSSGTGLYRTPSGFEVPAREIQEALKEAGYYKGEVDGKIGPTTRSAIRAFQAENGLTADGVCGRGTWDKLKTHLSSAEK